MPLNQEDKNWLDGRLQRLATKQDLEQLKTDLIGEDAKLLREIRAHVKDRIAAYHPQEHLSD